METKQTNEKLTEKRFALLIDADNVSAKYVAVILDELSKYGTVTYKRIYGDWTTTLHSKWKVTLLENSIIPIQQFSYTQGKNATDHAMIIDAMDILYTGQVDGFCIASSDSDFTRLAARIRESGLTVIGMGEKKTPLAFRKACDIFTTLEILLDEVPTKRGRKHTGHEFEGPAPSIAVERIEEAVDAIVTYNLNNGKATGLGEVGSRLQKRYPDFDVRNYGTNQLRKLLESFESLSVIQEGNSISVFLVDDASAQSAASYDSSANEDAPAMAPVAHADEPAIIPDENVELSTVDATEHTAGDNATSSDAASENGKTKRTRRGGRRRKSTTILAETSSPEQADENQSSNDLQAATSSEDQPSSDEAPVEAAREEDAAAPSTDEPSQKAQTKKATRAKTAKKPARQEEESGSKPDETAGAEPEPQPEPAAKPPASKKRARKAAPAPANSSSDAPRENEAPSSDATEVSQTPSNDMRVEVDRYLVTLLSSAGSAGISLQTVGKRLRSKFRTFRLHDLGYTKLKDLLVDMDTVVIEKRENTSYALLKNAN